MDSLLLRRERRQVLPDLPPRYEHVYRPLLSPEQRRLAGDAVRPAGALQVTEAELGDCLDAVVSRWQRGVW
ncbi:MAG: hypothetical protein HYV63_13110 [Candidatus Schekmanbacteria bacterium]|nr:hypothetical protein [Candidatus Schekmanbacteria bacterium]